MVILAALIFSQEEPKDVRPSLIIAMDTYSQKDPVLLQLQLSNTSQTNLKILVCPGLWTLRNHLWLTLRKNGAIIDRKKSLCQASSYPNRSSLHAVKPGKAITMSFHLNSLFDIDSPGDYVLEGRFSTAELGKYVVSDSKGSRLIDNPGVQVGPVSFSVLPVPPQTLAKTESRLINNLQMGNVDETDVLHLLNFGSEKAIGAAMTALPRAVRKIPRDAYAVLRDSLYVDLCCMPNRELAVQAGAEIAKHAIEQDRYLGLDIVRSRGKKNDAKLLKVLLDDLSPNMRWEAVRCIEQLLGIDVSKNSGKLLNAPERDDPLILQAKKLLSE